MNIHLVTYATPKYRHRQIILSLSARLNHVVKTTSLWTIPKLQKSDFGNIAPWISLTERGSGFWAWKPFIILKTLNSIPEGDIVFYCDVGRKYPYILLENSLEPYLNWMKSVGQEMLPGVMIPWNGPLGMWTKLDAFRLTNMDVIHNHEAIPIQASFSFWCANPATKTFVKEWLDLCVQRQLISDDPNTDSRPNLSSFRGHRHDQSLLTLCCLKHGIKGLDLGQTQPSFDERNPDHVSKFALHAYNSPSLLSLSIRVPSKILAWLEKQFRKGITLGKSYE